MEIEINEIFKTKSIKDAIQHVLDDYARDDFIEIHIDNKAYYFNSGNSRMEATEFLRSLSQNNRD